jgi:CRP-like cAMP-binding protein
MKGKPKPSFDADAFLRSAGAGKTILTYQPTDVIFSQGDASDSVLYIQEGAVKLSVQSHGGKEAVVAMLGPGDFFGERALAGHPVRLEAATAMTATTVLSIPKRQMIRLLHDQHALSDRFITYMLARNIRIEEDLVDQLFNSSEKRLARTLLAAGALRQARPDTSRAAEDPSGDTRGNGRHDALARQFLHEQVQETRVHRIQRRPQGPSFALNRHRARLARSPDRARTSRARLTATSHRVDSACRAAP